MVSSKQLAANRENALKSTGPVTAAGKAKTSRNATRHGILAKMTVLTGFEKPEDWEAHLEQMRADLQPEGYMEEVLVDRISQLQWRLARVARYEGEAASVGIERADYTRVPRTFLVGGDELPPRLPVDDAEEKAEAAREHLAMLQHLPDAGDGEGMAGVDVMRAATKAAGIALKAIDHIAGGLPGWSGDELYTVNPWPAKLVREVISRLCKFVGVTLEELYERMLKNARRGVRDAAGKVDRLKSEIARRERLSIIPDEKATEKIRRYESHLERGLYQALHELQRLQAARREGMQPPVAVDVTVVDAESEG